MRFDVATLGGLTEIVCERGLPAVPLLVATINLTALAGGALPLHASAFEVDGRGVVTTGWSKGGKTGGDADLRLARRALRRRRVGLRRGRRDARARPARADPAVGLAPGAAARGACEGRAASMARLRGLRAAADAGTALARRRDGRGKVGTLATRGADLVRGQLHVDAPPERLFGAEALALTSSFDRLFLVTSADDPETVAEPVDPLRSPPAWPRRCATSASRSWRSTRSSASPSPTPATRHSRRRRAREAELLRRVFAGKPAWEVRHPYPVDFAALHAAMAPHV